MPRAESKLLKILYLCIILYLFLLSIDLFGAAFKLFGKDLAENLISSTSNPFVGLLIGILATSIIQSSSTTTSILVALVGAGAISVENAVPIVMGANIGTTITNVFVSLGHISRKAEFEKAFACAIVHDLFNLLAVMIFFPIQLATRFLSSGATLMAEQFQNCGGLHFASPVKVLVKPAEQLVVQLCGRMPGVVLVLALFILFFSLRYLVIVLKALFLTRLEAFFDKYIFKTTLRSLFFGLVLTTLVQSSSVTTSLVVPLVAAGILRLEQIYPYTLGANVGTTVTAILAALATGHIAAVTVAFAHLLFNISGIIVFLPLRALPIYMARTAAKLSLKNRLYPILFVLVVFFLIPLGLLYLTK